WWTALFFLFPFLKVGGFWAFLSWGKVLDSAGRDGIELDAFCPEAVSALFKGLFEHGTIPGLIGLVVAAALIMTIRVIKKVRKSDSNETFE
ncbi:MAG: hypothetical protein K8F91_23730, partial [Candidatus Obscuribacterales bacterium]|nr:hypothetical protein [Candidatus Obscuribacterales bacterium]